jgi:hypothetical protein
MYAEIANFAETWCLGHAGTTKDRRDCSSRLISEILQWRRDRSRHGVTYALGEPVP